MSDDPFTPTPPTAEDQAHVESGIALLLAASDRLEQILNATPSLLWLMDLIPLLRDAAREAEEIGPNRFAVALAQRVMAEADGAQR